MMNCHRATALISQGCERKLTFAERMKLKLHTSLCGGCANFERQLPLLGAAARKFAHGDDRSDV